MYGAIGSLALGGITLVNWGFTMFSDHWYADMVRYQSKRWFNLGRNTESVITPAAGMFFVVAGFDMLFFPDPTAGSVWGEVLAVLAVAFLALAVVGMIPFRLPGPMYPEWQLERRRRVQEAARANWEHETGSIVPRGRHAAPPETVTDGGDQYTRYAGDAAGDDPLKSRDSLPTRARSPHDEDSGPGDGMNI